MYSLLFGRATVTIGAHVRLQGKIAKLTTLHAFTDVHKYAETIVCNTVVTHSNYTYRIVYIDTQT